MSVVWCGRRRCSTNLISSTGVSSGASVGDWGVLTLAALETSADVVDYLGLGVELNRNYITASGHTCTFFCFDWFFLVVERRAGAPIALYFVPHDAFSEPGGSLSKPYGLLNSTCSEARSSQTTVAAALSGRLRGRGLKINLVLSILPEIPLGLLVVDLHMAGVVFALLMCLRYVLGGSWPMPPHRHTRRAVCCTSWYAARVPWQHVTGLKHLGSDPLLRLV